MLLPGSYLTKKLFIRGGLPGGYFHCFERLAVTEIPEFLIPVNIIRGSALGNVQQASDIIIARGSIEQVVMHKIAERVIGGIDQIMLV